MNLLLIEKSFRLDHGIKYSQKREKIQGQIIDEFVTTQLKYVNFDISGAISKFSSIMQQTRMYEKKSNFQG